MFVLRLSISVQVRNKLIENKASKHVGVLYKTSKLLNSKFLRNIYFSFIHSYINDADVAWSALIKLNLKKCLGNKNKLRVLCLIKIDLHMQNRSTYALLKALNALNVYLK